MAALNRAFDVLRIMINTTNNDQILQPASEEQFVIVDKTKITGTQKSSCIAIGKMRVEDLLRIEWPVPISRGDTGSRDPKLTDTIVRTLRQEFRINNDHLLFG